MNIKNIGIISLSVILIGAIFYLLVKPVIRKISPAPHEIQGLLNGFVKVDGGSFLMGGPDSLESDDESPQHLVYVSTFSIQNKEVSQELYELVMGNNPSENKTWKDMPVTNVTWEDCQDFIKVLNEITGMDYRLPTEAEWEYAARGGLKSNGYRFSGANTSDEVGWHIDNSQRLLHVAGEKKPNELGLYDMSGNVFEWCSDWYAPYRTDSKTSENPKGPDYGDSHVLRGGSYRNTAYYFFTTSRTSTSSPNKRSNDLGFRLVLPAVR